MLRFAPYSVSVSRPQSLVKPVSLEDGNECKLSEVLKTQEGRRTRSPMAVTGKLRQEKEQQEPGVGASHAEAVTEPRVGQESTQAVKRDQDAAKGSGHPAGDQQPEPALGRKVVVRRQLQDKEGQGTRAPQGEQRKEVEETQQRASPEVGGCWLREVKILTKQGSHSIEEKTASVVTSSLDQQVSGNGQGISPQGARSWVWRGQRERESPKVPGGKRDLWPFGQVFSESCKSRGGEQGPTPSFLSLSCPVLITFSGSPC